MNADDSLQIASQRISVIDRRTFLAQAAAASTLMVPSAFPELPSGAGTLDTNGRQKIASLLTGKADLPPAIVDRACAALSAEDPGFETNLATLAARIESARLADADAFRRSSLAAEPALMTTATALIAALYTGQTGRGWRGHYVAYEEALMYRLTKGITVVPTYSSGPADYWTKPPAEKARTA